MSRMAQTAEPRRCPGNRSAEGAITTGASGSPAGPVGGYHCWAKLYLGGVGWVPVDASEAQKNPALAPYYFGNLTADRVQVSSGRDVNLVPKQAEEALNYFVYPYAEADGKKITRDGEHFVHGVEEKVQDLKNPTESAKKPADPKTPDAINTLKKSASRFVGGDEEEAEPKPR